MRLGNMEIRVVDGECLGPKAKLRIMIAIAFGESYRLTRVHLNVC